MKACLEVFELATKLDRRLEFLVTYLGVDGDYRDYAQKSGANDT